MSSMNVKKLAMMIEEDADDGALWRRSWCTRTGDNKDYHYEFPAMTSEEIKNGKKTKNVYPAGHPKAGQHKVIAGRGYETQPKQYPDSYMCYSIYLKYHPEAYCIDFDEGWNHPDNEFFKQMKEEDGDLYGSLSVKTKKGWHFYFYIEGVPDFTCSTKLGAKEEYGDVDLLGRKKEGQMNVVEKFDAQVFGDGILSIKWSDISKFFNEKRMMSKDKKSKKDKMNKTEKQIADAMGVGDGSNSKSVEEIRGYLSQLNKKKHYDYEEWFKVGCILWNNFSEKETGFALWKEWSASDPKTSRIDGESKLRKAWGSIHHHPEPATWRTLRRMTGNGNIYQEIYDETGREGVCRYMNNSICYNRNTSSIVYIDFDDISDFAESKEKSESDMRSMMKKYLIHYEDEEGKKKKLNPFDCWIECPARLDVARVLFDPRPTAPKNVFNLWRGFKIAPEDVADIHIGEAKMGCQKLLEHIRLIWCKGNEEYYNFVLNWFAFLLQFPEKKVGVLLVVKSNEGSGKGIVFEVMKAILGDRLYAQIGDVSKIVAKNNSILVGRVLVNGDEAHWGGDVKTANKLKGLITETELQIEDKYIKSFKVFNSTAFCFSSNEDKATSAREGDRRHFGLELDDKWAGRQKSPEHAEYFSSISGMPHHGVSDVIARSFAKVLYSRDLTGFNNRNIPMTDYISKQIQQNWDIYTTWWFQVLQSGCFTIKEQFKRNKRVACGDGVDERIFPERMLDYGKVGTFSNGSWENGMKKSTEYLESFPDSPCESALYFRGLMDERNVDEYQRSGCRLYDLWWHLAELWGHPEVKEKRIPMPSCLLDGIGEIWEILGKTDEKFIEGKRVIQGRRRYPKYINHAVRLKFPKGIMKYEDESGEGEWYAHECWADRQVESNPEIQNEESMFFLSDDNKIHHSFNAVKKGDKFFEEFDWDSTKADVSKADFHESNIQEVVRPENFPRLCEKFFEISEDGVELTDKSILEGYLEKWQEVNSSNFHLDLCVNQWYDRKGDRIDYGVRKEKVKVWLYDKDWVYEIFTQSPNRHDNRHITNAVFWEKMATHLGGWAKEGNGGMMHQTRLKITDSQGNEKRKIYWSFVSLENARKKFETWANRKVDWQEPDEEVCLRADEMNDEGGDESICCSDEGL